MKKRRDHMNQALRYYFWFYAWFLVLGFSFITFIEWFSNFKEKRARDTRQLIIFFLLRVVSFLAVSLFLSTVLPRLKRRKEIMLLFFSFFLATTAISFHNLFCHLGSRDPSKGVDMVTTEDSVLALFLRL